MTGIEVVVDVEVDDVGEVVGVDDVVVEVVGVTDDGPSGVLVSHARMRLPSSSAATSNLRIALAPSVRSDVPP